MEKVAEWENMTQAEKKEEFFRRQKETLDLFLERNAISREEYDHSLTILINKMGFQTVIKQNNPE